MQFTHSQHVCVYIRRIQHTGDWLNKDKESDDHQEQAIDESRKYFNTTIPAKNTIFKHPAEFDILQITAVSQTKGFFTCSRGTLPIGEDPGGFPASHEGGKQAED